MTQTLRSIEQPTVLCSQLPFYNLLAKSVCKLEHSKLGEKQCKFQFYRTFLFFFIFYFLGGGLAECSCLFQLFYSLPFS